MKTKYIFTLFLGVALAVMAEDKPEKEAKMKIFPVEHASMVLQQGKTTIYVDPVGEAAQYAKFPKPDIILITHIHHDHLSPALVRTLKKDTTTIIGPKSVHEQLQECKVIGNGEKVAVEGITIEAIPAYNLTKERLKYHPKARGDHGYVLQTASERIYISGDTEDIKEMRALKNIDHAIICMNLPYTMTEEKAASAVLEMKPNAVTPYHYRGKDGISDLKTFKRAVEAGDSRIAVKIMDWYPDAKK